MQRRSVLILLLLLTGSAAVAAWWRHGAADEPVPPTDGTSSSAPRSSAPPAAATRPQDPMPAPPGALQVRVDVQADEAFVPPSPARVRARWAGDARELPAIVLAGAGAGFDASPRAAGAALVAIGDGPGRLLRQVALAAGEEATVELGGRLVVRGRIRGKDRKPVPGSRVWFGEFDGDGARREAIPNEEGDYEAEVPAGRGVPFVVRAPGHAASWRIVDIVAPTGPCDADLQRACALEVQLAGVAVAMDQARVFVLPGATVAGAVANWPFFEQVLTDGAALDANGRALLEELPAAGEVVVLVRHPRAVVTVSSPVALKGERQRALVPMDFGAEVRSGRVVDEHDQPVAGATVIARAAGGPLEPGTSQRLLPPHLAQRGLFWTTTDAEGAFALGVPAAPGAVLSVRKPGHAGRDLVLGSLVAGARLVLPAWRADEAALVVTPPRPGEAWVVETNLGGGLRDVLAADRAWRVALPHAGRFRVRITTAGAGEAKATASHDAVLGVGVVELAAPLPQ